MGEYPTEEDLQRIRAWSPADPLGWFAFIKSVWWANDWGWSESEREIPRASGRERTYFVSTGGWSGNEEIIGVMQENILWTMSWHMTRRGGHYVFAVPFTVAPQ